MKNVKLKVANHKGQVMTGMQLSRKQAARLARKLLFVWKLTHAVEFEYGEPNEDRRNTTVKTRRPNCR